MYGAEASVEGPEPRRGSLDEVIPHTADEISSRLEQIRYRYSALGSQVSREALGKVNRFTRPHSSPDLLCYC